jgi:hypothetical protein
VLFCAALLFVFTGIGMAYGGTIEDLGDFESGQSLSPYLNAACVGRNTDGALVLWFFGNEVPGNYMLVPKIGSMWVLTYKGQTFNFIPLKDSRFRLERRI